MNFVFDNSNPAKISSVDRFIADKCEKIVVTNIYWFQFVTSRHIIRFFKKNKTITGLTFVGSIGFVKNI